jgi:hypothetical protein
MQEPFRRAGGFGELTERFFQMEGDLDLFAKKIDGVYFWERVRFGVHRTILKETGIHEQTKKRPKPTLLIRAITMLMGPKNIMLRNPYFSPPKDVLFVGHPRRKMQEDGKWWDIYCDPIIENLGLTYGYFEHSYLNTHLEPAKTVGTRYLDFIDVLADIGNSLRIKRIRLSRTEGKLLRDIEKEIVSRFGVDIHLERRIKKNLADRKNRLPLYKLLLRKVAPKVAVIIVSYQKETFIEACKALNIPVIELQHGVISCYSMAYSFPGPHSMKRSFPDYFLTFGDYWKKCVEFPIKKERIYNVGYPYFELEAKKYANMPKKNQIVFISQGTVGKEMSKFAAKFAKNSSPDQKIVYKLHPAEYGSWRKEYPWLAKINITVIDDNRVPLYQLFAESKIQIGVYSTAIYEGLSFGLRTFLLNLPGVEYMEDLIEKKYAVVVNSVSALEEYLRHAESSKLPDTENLFRSDAVNNICEVLYDIVSSGQPHEI